VFGYLPPLSVTVACFRHSFPFSLAFAYRFQRSNGLPASPLSSPQDTEPSSNATLPPRFAFLPPIAGRAFQLNLSYYSDQRGRAPALPRPPLTLDAGPTRLQPKYAPSFLRALPLTPFWRLLLFAFPPYFSLVLINSPSPLDSGLFPSVQVKATRFRRTFRSSLVVGLFRFGSFVSPLPIIVV